MPSAARVPSFHIPLYSKTELTEQRRNILRYARSFPPGPVRNRHRQTALLLRSLFKDEKWLRSHATGCEFVACQFRNE
jgi:hypothetical protein